MVNEFKIGKTPVGNSFPPYFIADIAANHDGDLNRACKLIELAKEAGANAAKFQNFKAARIVSKFGFTNLGDKLSHQKTWQKSVYEIYEDASISQDWTAKLKAKCDEVGIEYFTSPYDFESVDHVDRHVNVYKIGSGDITWLEIIEYIARKGKPVLIATGASDMGDVDRAMAVLRKWSEKVCLMQCNTNYTVDAGKYKYVNLNVLSAYRRKYPDVLLGLSDHTLGHATVVGAIPLGARIIEKHFTDDNNRVGPDHQFAMNPASWRIMVDSALEVFYALGDGIKRIEENEAQSVVVQRRCLRAIQAIEKGTRLGKEHFEALRPIPEGGLEPYRVNEIVGKVLSKSLQQGEHITLQHIS